MNSLFRHFSGRNPKEPRTWTEKFRLSPCWRALLPSSGCPVPLQSCQAFRNNHWDRFQPTCVASTHLLPAVPVHSVNACTQTLCNNSEEHLQCPASYTGTGSQTPCLPDASSWGVTREPLFYEQKVGCTPLDVNWTVIKNLSDFLDTEGKSLEKLRGLACCNLLH